MQREIVISTFEMLTINMLLAYLGTFNISFVFHHHNLGKLMTEEDKESGAVDSGTYTAYMKAAGGYFVSIFVAVIYFIPVGCAAFSHWWLSYWVSQGAGEAVVDTVGIHSSLPSFDSCEGIFNFYI